MALPDDIWNKELLAMMEGKTFQTEHKLRFYDFLPKPHAHKSNWDPYLWDPPVQHSRHVVGMDKGTVDRDIVDARKYALEGMVSCVPGTSCPTCELIKEKERKVPTKEEAQRKKARKNFDMKANTEINRIKRKRAREERAALTWKFGIPHIAALQIEEIAETLTRENPIAYVQQNDYNSTAFVVVHRYLYKKSTAIGGELSPAGINFTGMSGLHMFVAVTKASKMSAVLKWAKAVNSAKWPEGNSATITVSYPKI